MDNPPQLSVTMTTCSYILQNKVEPFLAIAFYNHQQLTITINDFAFRFNGARNNVLRPFYNNSLTAVVDQKLSFLSTVLKIKKFSLDLNSRYVIVRGFSKRVLCEHGQRFHPGLKFSLLILV